MRPLALFGLAAIALTTTARAVAAEWDPGEGAKLKLSADGKASIRFLTWHQVWLRHGELNPGSIVREQERDTATDIGIRRSRFLIHARPTADLTIVLHFGINNQSTVGGGFGAGTDGPKKPQLFVHDAYGEQRVLGQALYLGAGLHYWNGISRMSSASTVTFLGIDSPIVHWPTIDKTDQFARMIGVYAKGELGRAHYRVALNQPFVTESKPAERRADFASDTRTFAVQGYAKIDLFDKESHALPYFAGTYLGKKRVLSLGVGWFYHPRGAVWLEDGARVHGAVLLRGLDAFLDLPMDRGRQALTAYASLLHYDLGPNYLRSVGIMNPSTGLATDGRTSINGAGNAAPILGTGTIVYAQAGWLLPGTLGDAGRLQPYVAFTLARFDALDDRVTIPEAGVNWLIVGHHAKLTLHARSRPVFFAQPDGRPRAEGRKGEVIVQGQFFF
ncbi:MAG: hypothetical protein HYV09_07360 [Deltaproteobacteria bacterium]|nr:hypothetical protein [Deltaproteobacteria bacterium]